MYEAGTLIWRLNSCLDELDAIEEVVDFPREMMNQKLP